VLALAGTICLVLIVWALAPAIFRLVQRPAGDGVDIESYGFDLTGLLVPRELVVPGMLHRDMVQPIDEPAVLSAADAGGGGSVRDKFLLDGDQVVGVVIGDEARAYPVSVMNVHEIVHDRLGGMPIAVTYHWPSGCVRVVSRIVDGREVGFGVSGLLYNSNMLMYDRGDAVLPEVADGAGGAPESLWCQLLATAVSGPAAGRDLHVIPAELVSWRAWRQAHPNTTVVGRDPSVRSRRYRKSDPDTYFQRGRVIFPAAPAPPAIGPPALAPVVAVEVEGHRRVYPLAEIERRIDDEGTWHDTVSATRLRFDYDRASETVLVTAPGADSPPRVEHALWFAWHAMHPEDTLVWTGSDQTTEGN
jgi:hypothetical protein